jgi:hypothetical protein
VCFGHRQRHERLYHSVGSAPLHIFSQVLHRAIRPAYEVQVLNEAQILQQMPQILRLLVVKVISVAALALPAQV